MLYKAPLRDFNHVSILQSVVQISNGGGFLCHLYAMVGTYLLEVPLKYNPSKGACGTYESVLMELFSSI